VSSKKKCHATVYSPDGRSRVYARCRCGWKGQVHRGEIRTALTLAWVDARGHDPLFPQGSKPEDMA